MKILAVNMFGIPSGIRRTLFDANVFQDYDAVIVDPKNFEQLYSTVDYRASQEKMLSTKYGKRINHLNERRQDEVRGILRSGGIVVCLLEPVQVYWYEDIFQHKTIWSKITNYDWLFTPREINDELGEIIYSVGESIDVVDTNHPFAQYLSIKPRWSAYVEKDECEGWKILASAFGTHVLSLTKRIEMGHVVFIPSYYDSANGELLERSIVELRKGQRVATQPYWAKEITVPGQQELLERMEELNQHINSLEKERMDISDKIQALGRWKYLLYGKGKYELEPVVREALSLIGCSVEPQPDKDSDGIISSEFGTALLEATGSKSTIRIEKLGELNTNIGNYISKRRRKVKGIIAGNPFCEELPRYRPPENSQKQLFAKELVESANDQGIAVILTSELYDIVAKIINGEIPAENLISIREKLFIGKGLIHLT